MWPASEDWRLEHLLRTCRRCFHQKIDDPGIMGRWQQRCRCSKGTVQAIPEGATLFPEVGSSV